MTWPMVLLWLFIIYGAVSRGPLLLYIFSVSIVFGGLTMLPPGLTGHLNVPAQTVCGAILIVKILLRSDNLKRALQLAVDVRKLGLLTLFIVYAVFSSVIYPRLFAGNILLYSLNAAGSLSPLAPTSANFTQASYLMVSVGMVFVFAVAGRNPVFIKHYLQSVLFAGIGLVLSGLIALLLTSTGHLSLLLPFHNASYNLLIDEQIQGHVRVVGFMPEASVYGAATCITLSFLVFTREFFEPWLRKYVVPATIMAELLFTYLSTSSTGYLGLIVLGIIVFGRVIGNLMLVKMRTRPQLQRGALIIFGGVVCVVVLMILPQSMLASISKLVNAMIFQKSTSSSYLERTMWTQAGLSAFWGTHGIGVGVGSVRTSNWYANILASTGVIGVGLLGVFVFKLLLPLTAFSDKAKQHFSMGLKLAILPGAVMIGVAGTTPDPGVWVTTIFGLLYSLHLQPSKFADRRLSAAKTRLNFGSKPLAANGGI